MSAVVQARCTHSTRCGIFSSNISETLQRWRRQIASRTTLAERRGIRPFALIGCRIAGTESGTLVPLERLSFVVMFDDRNDDDRLSTRLLGFRARWVSDRLQIGGPEGSLFDKDVRLAPGTGSGSRLDPHDAELCELALGWEQHLERLNRHPHFPRRNILRWPAWWCVVGTIPSGLPTKSLGRQQLVPLETAVARGLSITGVFADVAGLPKRQVLAGADPRRLLSGGQGVVAFDLVRTRFRRAE